MLTGLYHYFTGTYTVTIPEQYRLKAVNLLYENSVEIMKSAIACDGSFIFRIVAFEKNKLCKILNDNTVDFVISPVKGFPKLLKYLKYHTGIVLGILIFVAVMFFTSHTIWKIEVKGNSQIANDEIIHKLELMGCTYGTYFPSLDFDALHSNVLAANNDLAWISVNMKGNHAYVEVMETKTGSKEKQEEGIYANLVASEDAQILLTKTEKGITSVQIGDVVKKGQLLVSGIIPVGEENLRYEYAAGEIFAYVPRQIEVKIPLNYREKVYTGETITEKSLIFLKKNIFFSRKGGFEHTSYDKIEESVCLSFFGFDDLPLWFETIRYKEYIYIDKNLSPNEAVAKAMADVRCELDTISAECELVSNKVSVNISDTDVTVKYDLVCIKNIAEIKEFTVSEDQLTQ